MTILRNKCLTTNVKNGKFIREIVSYYESSCWYVWVLVLLKYHVIINDLDNKLKKKKKRTHFKLPYLSTGDELAWLVWLAQTRCLMVCSSSDHSILEVDFEIILSRYFSLHQTRFKYNLISRFFCFCFLLFLFCFVLFFFCVCFCVLFCLFVYLFVCFFMYCSYTL